MKVVNNIRKYREAKGIKMKELAQELGVIYTHMCYLETHKQQIIRGLDVDKAAEILGVKPDDLFKVVT